MSKDHKRRRERAEDLRFGNDPLGDPSGQSGDRRVFAVNQKQPAVNRPPRRNPANQLGTVGVTRIIVDTANARGDFDFLTLDADSLRTVIKKPPQRAARLEAGQQDCCFPIPKPTLEMVADPAGIAHAARGNDDVESRKLFDRLAFADSLGETQMRRLKNRRDIDIGAEFRRVLAENLGGANGQGRIEKDRRVLNLALLHEIDEIDDQLLGALDREGWDEEGTVATWAWQTSAARLSRRDFGVIAGRSRSP